MHSACETTLRMTPPPSPSRSFRSQISIFAVLPFSPFLPFADAISSASYRAGKQPPPSGFPERTSLKVSTISRDNHRRTAANSLMHMCAHRYTVYRSICWQCARVNVCTNKCTCGRASAERRKRENGKGISFLFTRNAPRSLFALRFFAQNCKTCGTKRDSRLNENNC